MNLIKQIGVRKKDLSRPDTAVIIYEEIKKLGIGVTEEVKQEASRTEEPGIDSRNQSLAFGMGSVAGAEGLVSQERLLGKVGTVTSLAEI